MNYLTTGWGLVKTASLWLRASTSDREHIFITGAPRSGTTLIKTILTAHPEMAGGDYESTGLFKIRDLYQYSNDEINNGWVHISCEEAGSFTEFYNQLADALLEYYGGNRFVDKVWPHGGRFKLVTSIFPYARWIHIVRDGRDCYCSARHHPNVPQSKSLDRFARYWQRCNQLVDRYVPSRRKVTIRYEDLVSNPDEEIFRIMRFLGFQVDEAQFYPAASGPITSLQERDHHKRLAQPINAKSVGRNARELSPVEQQRFLELAGNGLRKYGYLDASSTVSVT